MRGMVRYGKVRRVVHDAALGSWEVLVMCVTMGWLGVVVGCGESDGLERKRRKGRVRDCCSLR